MPITSRSARHGEKTIEIKIRLWTNNIGPRGKIIPKHAWTSGEVQMDVNESHGIKPGNSKKFESLLDMGAAVEKVLIANGITLHQTPRMKKYMK